MKDWHEFGEWMVRNRELGVQVERDVYWDVRPRKDLGTLEVRFVDSPLDLKNLIEVVSLILAITAVLIQSQDLPFSFCITDESELTSNRDLAIEDGMLGTFRIRGQSTPKSECCLSIIEVLKRFNFEDDIVVKSILRLADKLPNYWSPYNEVFHVLDESNGDFVEMLKELSRRYDQE